MQLEVGTKVAGTIGEYGAAEQGAARVEVATGVTNHPLVVPPAGVVGLDLGLDLQGNGKQDVLAVAQGVAVAPLQDQETLVINDEPTSRLGHVTQGLHVDSAQQRVVVDLAQLNPHQP